VFFFFFFYFFFKILFLGGSKGKIKII